MQKRAICNIKNPVGRRLTLALVFPIIVLIAVVVFFYALFVGAKEGLRTAGREISYHCQKFFRLAGGGVELAWMGQEAYDAREKVRQQAKIQRYTRRGQ